MTRMFLTAIALLYFAFGAWSITDPAAMTARMGVDIGGPAGLFEMRGVFGGVSLGAGLLCLAGAFKISFQRPALWFLVAYMGGYLIGRGASFLAGDSALTTSWIFAGFEGLVFILACLLLARRPA